jgi:lysyl-tRNA synthetase class 2
MEDEFAARLAKVDEIRARGDDPYPVRFDRTHTLQSVREQWDDAIDAGSSTDDVVRVAGRVLLKRTQGRLIFAKLRDGSGELQLFVSQGELGKDSFARFSEEVDRGDWVGVEGKVMKTKLGELSVNISSFQVLAKALRPLPEKWHGLSDTDTRYRQRYVDLIATRAACSTCGSQPSPPCVASSPSAASSRSRRRCCTRSRAARPHDPSPLITTRSTSSSTCASRPSST